jgi:pimeloyl-ACP methyl ester carboxylesterase
VLVHGAFAESASWNPVIERLHQEKLRVVAAANPLRSLSGDAASVRDVLASIEGPIVLVGHSYGGLVITQAAAGLDSVKALVYVGAFAGDTGENAFDLSGKFPGSSLGDALAPYPLADGGTDLVIRQDVFHHQFAADVPEDAARTMAVTQRPVTQKALTDPVVGDPAWKTIPSWFVFGQLDLNIPVELHRYMAERANSRGTQDLSGVSHALSVSRPAEVAGSILDAVAATS